MTAFSIILQLAALATALLSGMGVGGGGLLVIWLTLSGAYEQLAAQGINLIFFMCAAGTSLAVRIKSRRFDPKLIAVLAVTGIPGALAGSRIAELLEQRYLRLCFGAFMLVSGAASLIASFVKKKRS